MKEIKRQEGLIDKLSSGINHDVTDALLNPEQGKYFVFEMNCHNSTIYCY